MTALLRLEGVACARGGAAVLAGVSLALGAGEMLVLRGPNGAGKTTLLRTVAGLQPPLAGTIETEPDSLAYAAHADGLKGALTVAENLAFWARIFGAPGIGPALTAYELDGLADRPAQNLSAGQKRRLGLARLLVAARPVWLLDEPTVSLDAAALGLFAAALRAHLGSGGAALVATHADLGIEAPVLDVTPYRARPEAHADAFAEAVE